MREWRKARARKERNKDRVMEGRKEVRDEGINEGRNEQLSKTLNTYTILGQKLVYIHSYIETYLHR